MDRDFIIRAELCTEQLANLIADYWNHAQGHGIDLQGECHFAQRYRELVEWYQNSRYINSICDLLECEKVIEEYSEYIVSF